MFRSREHSNDLNNPRSVEPILADAPQWWKDKVMELRNAPTEEAREAIMKRRGIELRAEKRSAAPSSLADLAWWQFTRKFPTLADFREARKREADASDESRTRRKALLNSLLN
jgi:hypothetical protein